MHHAEVYMYSEQYFFHMLITPRKMQTIHSKPTFIEKGLYFAAFYVCGKTF